MSCAPFRWRVVLQFLVMLSEPGERELDGAECALNAQHVGVLMIAKVHPPGREEVLSHYMDHSV